MVQTVYNPSIIIADGKSTWANRPSASAANGLRWLMTDIGRGTVMLSDGTYWRPMNGSAVIGGSNAAATITGSTNKTALGTLALLAGLANIPGASLLVETLWSVNNTAGGKGLKIELGSTTFYNITGASVLSDANYTMIRIRSQNSQIGMPVASASGLSTSAAACVVSTENMSTALNVTISAQLNNASDTATLEGWTVRLLTP